ncbi:hypothetical protein [Neogemmobacter tilapiae]|uniref:Uncharacterized protein n=1 Tax=Neogemmobacter tilapiae TaxID=875041 RepID=A0A918TP89_9RHOB|nr:hypothetical protein [Gemmobacter tilapiae]GHC56121.1 hypothetical protein GCM10007315_19230 [Gemmobacter tilapiae]
MFTIIANGTEIGYSFFENGDPPMGVAFGQFIPSANFTAFLGSTLPRKAAENGIHEYAEGISIESGPNKRLECAAISIAECNTAGSVEYEVTVLGIPSSLYEEFFPKHYADYFDPGS